MPTLAVAGISPQLLHLAATNPFAAALAGSRAPPHHQHQPEPPFDTGSGATDIEAYARTLAGMAGMGAMGMADVAGMGGSGSDSGVGFKRRSRGAAMPDLIKLEQDYMDCESLGPAKRGKGQRGDAYALSGLDSDEEDRAGGGGGLAAWARVLPLGARRLRSFSAGVPELEIMLMELIRCQV